MFLFTSFIPLCRSSWPPKLQSLSATVFLKLYGEKEPTPEQVLNTDIEQLRKIGLSYQKANYIRNIAQFALENGMDLKKLNKMSNEEVMEYLTCIKGVGKWTVEMLLMFALGREDIFSAGDYGIQTAMVNLYRIRHRDPKKIRTKMMAISAGWSPYRTYACMYLWRWKDGNNKKSLCSFEI